jgi:hypothetical protein
MIVKRLFLFTVATLCLPSKCYGFFFFFGSKHRCSSETVTNQRCGLFGWKFLTRIGIPGTDSCQEYCVFFLLSSSLECGGCDDIDVITPSIAPGVTSPTTVPIPSPILIDTSTIPTGSPVRTLIRTQVPVSVPTNAPMIDASSAVRYNIQLDLVGVTDTDHIIFTNASSRWESIVRGDLSDISSTALLRPPTSGCTYPLTIDDLYICSIFKPIDGVGRVLGSAGPIYMRRSNKLTITGEMKFDSADVNNLKIAGNLVSVILHEMGHILGMCTIQTIIHCYILTHSN